MEKKYAHLLSPIQLNGELIKNRILTPNASPLILQGPQTFPDDPYCAYFAGLARNGAAILDIADSCYYPRQREGDMLHFSTHVQAFDKTDPSVMNSISALADEIHFYGSKALVFMDIDFPKGYNMTADIPFGVIVDKTIQHKAAPKEMIPEILEMQRGYLRVKPELIRCDLYRFMAGDIDAVNSYRGEYMSNYAWAELTEAYMDRRVRENSSAPEYW